jgi:hypothetical protein
MARKQRNSATDTTEENTVSTETETPNFEDVTSAPEQDLDVDAPQATDAEDTVVETPTEDKPATKTSSRPAVPEGFISPVQFAKELTNEANPIRPQVVYSYIKNNGANSKHPFPLHSAEGRHGVVKAEEGINWWTELRNRVASSKAAAAEKAAKKTANSNSADATAAANADEAQEAVVEAE